VLNLARCQKFASFRPYCIVLPLFVAFVLLDSAEMSAAPILISKGSKIGKNDAKQQKETNTWHRAKFSTGATLNKSRAKFIPVLHLARCQLNVINVTQ